MKYLRNTLLMTLIAALIMPSPSVLAAANAGVEPVAGGDISQTTEAPANDASPSSPNSAATASSSQPESKPVVEQPTAKPGAQTNPPAAEPAHPTSQPVPTTDEVLEKTAPLLISKVSPDKKYIELYNPTDSNVKLADWKIENYKADVKTGGKEFKDEVILANDFLVLSNDPALTKAVRFDKVPSVIQGEGSVVLSRADGSVADAVGWGEAKKFLGASVAGGVKTVWRCFAGNLIVDSKNNLADFSSNKTADDQEVAPYTRPRCKTPEPPKPLNKCEGLKLNEIASHVDEPFIELVNGSNKTITTAGCKLIIDSNNSQEVFGDIELKPGELWAVKVNHTKLKLPRTKGKVYILDEAGVEVDATEYDKIAKDASWSLLDGEWMQTFAVTENAANVFKEYADCQAGYMRNESGKCVKIPAPSTVSDVLAPCPAGQYRHPETRRCKKIAAAADILKDCPEGFERNPTTRRCRKIKTASIPVVGSATAGVQHVAGATWGWWVFGGVSLLAIGYGAWQWRWEMSQLIRRLRR